MSTIYRAFGRRCLAQQPYRIPFVQITVVTTMTTANTPPTPNNIPDDFYFFSIIFYHLSKTSSLRHSTFFYDFLNDNYIPSINFHLLSNIFY